MKYTIIIEPRARRDLREIVEWMTDGKGDATCEWYREMVSAIMTLELFPSRCPLAPENEVLPCEVRQLIHGKRRNTYRIIFTIRENNVYLLHIRHCSRDWVQPEDLEQP